MKPNPILPPSDYPFNALEYATRVRLTLMDGRVIESYVNEYWPMPKDYKDVMDFYPYLKGEDEVWFLPDPRIATIEVLEKLDHPNHGGHPEVGYSMRPRMDGFE